MRCSRTTPPRRAAGGGRASDSTGAGGTQSPAEHTANAERAKANLADVVSQLLRRGVTYEQLGRLPVSGDWAMESLDAGGTPLGMLNRSPRAGALILEGAGHAGRFLPAIVERAPAPEGGWSMPSAYAYNPADLARCRARAQHAGAGP
jgi:hypothetical protein